MSGTTGFDYSTLAISSDIAEQTEQCLKNIASALRQAHASMADVVRVTYVLPDATQFKNAGQCCKNILVMCARLQ